MKDLHVRKFQWQYRQDPDPELKSWISSFEHLAIEIGCGAGLHPILWSQAHPTAGLIALERTKAKFSAFQQRLANHDCSNVFAVNDDATRWLPNNLQESVNEYFILYPNPYPKEKQANKRWYRSPFTHFILNSLKPCGRITMATNEAFLKDEALLYAKDCWSLDVVEYQTSKEQSWQPRTHFEKKYLKRQETCFNIVFQKT